MKGSEGDERRTSFLLTTQGNNTSTLRERTTISRHKKGERQRESERECCSLQERERRPKYPFLFPSFASSSSRLPSSPPPSHLPSFHTIDSALLFVYKACYSFINSLGRAKRKQKGKTKNSENATHKTHIMKTGRNKKKTMFCKSKQQRGDRLCRLLGPPVPLYEMKHHSS